MASNFHVQKPYVLTTLPRPLDPVTGRYVVGEVYGTVEGSKKRKRSEVTIGIDGEAVNIYDVSSARLVTSYPIPPQSSFTCPPCSFRRRIPGTKEFARYTYIATRDPSQSVTVFKDEVDSTGKTKSSVNSLGLGSQNPVVYLATRSTPSTKSATDLPSTSDELLAVRKNGEIIGLDGESLQQKWITSPALMYQDFSRGSKTDFQVEFCTLASASDIIHGIFKGNADSLSSLSSQLEPDTELLLVVSTLPSDGHRRQHLHILAPVPASQALGRGLLQMHVAPIGIIPNETATRSSYRLDIRSRSLLELNDGTLSIYDLSESIPKAKYTMELEGAASFLRLSKSSVLASVSSLLNVYNPQFRSIQSSTPLDLDDVAQNSSDSTKSRECELVAYFSRLELAIGIADGNLVAIQIEAPKTRTKKRRGEALLIDSIGRGVQQLKRTETSFRGDFPSTTVFSNYLPGSIRGDYWEKWTQDVKKADALFEADQLEDFDAFLASKLGLQVSTKQLANGVKENREQSQALPEWDWPKSRTEYSRVDRRWILYGIGKAFRWNKEHTDNVTIPRLVCSLPYTNLVTYLVDAGHLKLSNIKSALRDHVGGIDEADSVIAEQLVKRLAELDPTLELLTCYISATTLGPVELILSVRTIMQSLELIQDPKQPPPKLLTNGSMEESTEETDNGEFGMELDNLEQEIQKTESYLNGNTGTRGNGLSVAFAKLSNCPATSMIKALRATFKPEEILSLVYLLRIELVKGAWTSRYLDHTEFDEDTNLDAPPDGIITLIADLLGRCVDAIGPGGWLLNDALLSKNSFTADEPADFVASLKLEVSAALEGLEEAVYLRGIVGQTVKYCEAAQKAEALANAMLDVSKPMPMHVREPGGEALPLGVKPRHKAVDKTKVISGGEVVQRSARETGHLRSQQVGPYSLERIAI